MRSPQQSAQHDVAELARMAIAERRVVLGPCLAAMGFTEQGGPPPELPQQLRFDSQFVELEPWERDVLLGQASGDSEILLAHLAEGIAFQASCLSALHGLRSEPAETHDPTRLAELVDPAAVGLALQEEVQRDIDRLVAKGELGEAKKLTGFRRKIDQGVSSLNKILDDRTRQQARARSAAMVTPRMAEPVQRKRILPDVDLDLPAVVERALAPKQEPQPEPEAPELTAEELFELGLQEPEGSLEGEPCLAHVVPETGPDRGVRFRRLLYLLVFSVVTYALFLGFRPAEKPLPDRLGMDRFEHLDGVVQVRPRPPSLYVKLNSKTWAGMSPESRIGLVESLGRIAGDEGYFGVQVKTNDGKTVGQWLRKTGAALVEQQTGS